MKLYEVTRTFYVMAENESEAENYQPNDPLCCDNEVHEATIVLANWANAIPFGEQKDDKTCQEIINGK